MMRGPAAPPRTAVATMATAALVCLACLVLLPAPAASAVSDVVQGVAALVAAVSALRHAVHCPDGRTRTTWALVSAACASWAGGEAYWCWHTLRADVLPFPSLADVGFLGFAVLMAAALLVHPARRGRTDALRRTIDGVMTAAAVGFVSWLTALGAVADADEGTTALEYALLLAYPCSDVLLVVLAVLLLSRAGSCSTALRLVGAGAVALCVSDSAFAYLGAVGAYSGGLIDLGWILGFLLIALAGACPEPPAPADRPRAESTSASALPYVPVLVALAVVVVLTAEDRPLDKLEMLTACGIVLALLARQYLAVRDNAVLVRELAERERQLHRQAFSDSLTGLANRSLFLDRLEHVLELHARTRRPVAVVFLDLDGFKVVNDSFGHAAGDELLVRVAERITGATRAGDTVARLGGDEFAVLLEDAEDPLHVAGRIRSALADPFGIAGAELTVGASIGLAALGADEPTLAADTLLARSDAAMYGVKRSGLGGIGAFGAGSDHSSPAAPPVPVPR